MNRELSRRWKQTLWWGAHGRCARCDRAVPLADACLVRAAPSTIGLPFQLLEENQLAMGCPSCRQPDEMRLELLRGDSPPNDFMVGHEGWPGTTRSTRGTKGQRQRLSKVLRKERREAASASFNPRELWRDPRVEPARIRQARLFRAAYEERHRQPQATCPAGKFRRRAALNPAVAAAGAVPPTAS